MKKYLLKVLMYSVPCFLSYSGFATIRTVNNNPNSPGQYTKITDAITAAADGDTIMIAGSNTDYGDITISKRLTLIGTGYSPRKEVALVSKFGSITFSPGTSNNSVLYGLFIRGNVNGSGSALNGITIRRCAIVVGCNFNSVSNISIHDCIVFGAIIVTNCNNFLIANNIIYNYISGTGATNVLVKNNLFNGSSIGLYINDVLYSNNIFYYRSSATNTGDLCNACTNNVL